MRVNLERVIWRRPLEVTICDLKTASRSLGMGPARSGQEKEADSRPPLWRSRRAVLAHGREPGPSIKNARPSEQRSGSGRASVALGVNERRRVQMKSRLAVAEPDRHLLDTTEWHTGHFNARARRAERAVEVPPR